MRSISLKTVAIAFASIIASAPLLAKDVTVPALSAKCDSTSVDVAAPVPLPHLTAALAGAETIRIMAIGSSSTVGVGASTPAHNYPNQLGTILDQTMAGRNVTVLNRGISGEMAAATANRLNTLLEIDRPTLILWQVGTNDALARVPVEQFENVISTELRLLKSKRIDVVLVGLQYTPTAVRDEHYKAIRAALEKIAEKEAVLLVRRFAAMQFLEASKGEKLLSGDGLHLNDLGYRCMAEHIARAVVVSSFLKEKSSVTLGR